MDWDFWKDNKDAITTVVTVLVFLGGIGGGIWAVFKWGISRWWTNRVRGEVKVFELITDSTTLLSKLYATENDNSPLADHNIKYQPRDPKRDMQAELKAALNRSRYLLVTAPTGYGKTREAGMLAQTMMLEDWRVLRIRTGWLDMPKTLPEELGGNRSRVLIFLDDLNGLFSTGNLTQSPRVETEKSLLLSQSSYHDRLLQVLDMFEGMCTASEIRVIATARSEEEQWKVLGFSPNDKLWKRFERVELAEPADIAIVNLLEDTTKQADIKGDESDFEAIARASDGTYRNILLNLRRWRAQNKEINKNDFTETLDGSWQDIYERAVKKHPATKYLYDAIYILQQAGIELFPFLVESTASMLWGGNYFQKILHQRKISRTIHYLTVETSILRLETGKLAPSDGQIEAGKTSITWKVHKTFLINLLLKNSNQNIPNSIYGLSISFYYEKNFDQAMRLINRYIELVPSSPDGHHVKGAIFANIKRNKEAEDAYRKAINLIEMSSAKGEPKHTVIYQSLSLLLQSQKRYVEAEAIIRKTFTLNSKDISSYLYLGNILKSQQHLDEAEIAYRKAIELDPESAHSYTLLGTLLKDQQHHEEAETAYRKAFDILPTDLSIYYPLGELLNDQKRFEEVEAIYRKVIELKPEEDYAYSKLGTVLEKLNRFEEAEAIYRKGIELNPESAFSYYFLGNLLEDQKRLEEAESAYRKAFDINPTNFRGLGSLLNDQKRFEEAEAVYRKVIELNPEENYAHIELGTVLEKLNRFEEAEDIYRKVIELKPEENYAYSKLGTVLKKLNRFKEAEGAYRKVIELNPESTFSYYFLGNLLEDQKRLEEAESAYRKAFDINPTNFSIYSKLDNLLNDQGRFEEVESIYRKIIEIKPEENYAYSRLGTVLEKLNRFEESEAIYRKVIDLMPNDKFAYIYLVSLIRFNFTDRLKDTLPLLDRITDIDPENFGSYLTLASVNKELGNPVLQEHLDKVDQLMPKDDWYNRACLESVRDNFDLAFEYLQKAAQKEKFNPEWAWKDPDLQWIRNDPRFIEIVGTKPE